MIALLTGISGMKLPKPIRITSIEFNGDTITLGTDDKTKLIQVLNVCDMQWASIEGKPTVSIPKAQLQNDRALVMEIL